MTGIGDLSFNGQGFDGFLFMLLFLGLLLLMLVRQKFLAAFAAFLGFLETVIAATMPGSLTGYLLFFSLAGWLEAIVGERIMARWISRGGEP